MVVQEIPDDDSPEVLDWIQTYIDWANDNTEFTKSVVNQTSYLQERMKEFLKAKRRPHITLRKFDKEWFKSFFSWLKNIVAVFNKAVKAGKLRANPFYQLEKEDYFAKPKETHKQFLTPDELKATKRSQKRPTVSGKRNWLWFCLSRRLRISDIRALRWSNIMKKNEQTNSVIIRRKPRHSMPCQSPARPQWRGCPRKGMTRCFTFLPTCQCGCGPQKNS